MAKSDLQSTGATNIHTTFRYQVFLPVNNVLGITEGITSYIASAEVPRAVLESLEWHMPGGMKNHQAGKASTQPIKLEFVINADGDGNVYQMMENWRGACYDLNTGANKGKAGYSVSGIEVRLLAQDNTVKHRFTLQNAFTTDLNYGTMSSEGNELLKVDVSMVYDNYAYTAG